MLLIMAGHSVCLALLTLFAVPLSESTNITVNNCDDLIDSAHEASNLTMIQINCSSIALTSPVIFRDLKSLALDGQGASITCTSSEAGLGFVSIQNLTLTDFSLVNCSMWINATMLKRAALLILDGRDVTISDVRITNSTGTGLRILETTGNVEIRQSLFAYNAAKDNATAGLHVEITKPSALKCSYMIDQCTFTGNKESFMEQKCNYTEEQPKEEPGFFGGGFGLFLSNRSAETNMVIKDSIFDSNMATIGGAGLRIVLTGSISNSSIFVSETNFTDNQCCDCGGGGASIVWHLPLQQSGNKVQFSSCYFLRNEATYGGGVSVLNTRGGHHLTTNSLIFTNTTWEENLGWFGAAVDVRPIHWYHTNEGFLPNLNFSDCNILKSDVLINSEKPGSGGLRVSESVVTFSRSMTFVGNCNGSAFLMLNSVLKIAPSSTLNFTNNIGGIGGAMLLFQTSWISIEGEGTGAVNFTFINNTALNNGGAINLYTIDKQEIELSKSCFLQCHNRQEVNAFFRDNFAGGILSQANLSRQDIDIDRSFNHAGYGDIIYATTFKPCRRECRQNQQFVNDTYNYEFFNYTCNQCIVAVNASTQSDEYHVHRASTVTSNIVFNGDNPMKIIPGKDTHLNLTAYDDLNQPITTKYQASTTGNISLDKNYIELSNSSIKLHGQSCSNGTLKLTALGILGIFQSIDVELDKCPPGYVLDSDPMASNELSCICGSQYNKSTNTKYYEAIIYCAGSNFTAKLAIGNWAGYCPQKNTNNELFCTAPCPFGYCKYIRDVYLPRTASKTELEKLICSDLRKGNLCGQCKEGTTAAFHSETFLCVKNALCNWGPVFYVVSEILPITIIFLTIIFFSIDFSTGGVNSFILFAQILPLLFFSKANPNILKVNVLVQTLYHTYNVIYGFFNLEFFNIDPLAFCLWNGANPLDMLSIRYVSTLYALLLVIGVVIFLNYCACCLCWRRLTIWRRRRGFSLSIIHGIVAFLLLCYSQCVKVTIQLLTTSFVRTKEGKKDHVWVYYYAQYRYFSGEHLVYALPAILVLVTVVLMPPFLLMSYPVCYQVMALLHINETRAGLLLTRWIEKLKPFFDAFQSRFKDRFRFTAGLYFLYRVVPPAIFAAVDSTFAYYATLEVFFIIFFLFHSIAQPYRKMKNNLYHSLVMANLAIITGLYMYNYSEAQDTLAATYAESTIAVILLILIYLPVVCAVGHVLIRCGYKSFTAVKKSKNESKQTCDLREDYYHEFPARMLVEDDDAEIPTSFKYTNIDDDSHKSDE